MTHDIQLGVRLRGEYKLIVTGPNACETDWMPNLVLNQGLDRLAVAGANINAYCSIGTGTTTPANAQTGLVAYVAHQAVSGGLSNIVNAGASTYAAAFNYTYAFAQGAAVGNMAEIGVGWATGGVSLFSRCLIVDGAGTPTTLTLVSLDQLTVRYRVVVTPDLGDTSSSVTISGIAYSYVARIAQIAANFLNSVTSSADPLTVGSWGNHYDNGNAFSYPAGCTIGAITSVPSGTATGLQCSPTSAAGTYTTGNYYRDTTINIPVAGGNSAGGIGGLKLNFDTGGAGGHIGVWQVVFSTAIPKDNTKTLALVVRFSWGR